LMHLAQFHCGRFWRNGMITFLNEQGEGQS
jgi:hypothetical protein